MAATAQPQLLDVPFRLKRGGTRGDDSPELGLEMLTYAAGFLGGDLSLFAGKSMLDLGCGNKQAEAIVKYGVPFARYVGIDNALPLIEALAPQVDGRRMAFFHIDVFNQRYAPNGPPLARDTRLAVGDETFDILHAFSLFSHLTRPDAEAYFHILRRHAHAGSVLIFTGFIIPEMATWRDWDPDRPLLKVHYGPRFMDDMLMGAGWRVERVFTPDMALAGMVEGWDVRDVREVISDPGDQTVVICRPTAASGIP